MSSIIATREILLQLLGHIDFPNDLKKALSEWLNGRPKLLREKHPEVALILRQKPEFQTNLAKYSSYLKIDEIKRNAAEMEELAKPIIHSNGHTSNLDRPFDIVNDYDELLRLESLIRKVNIIDNRRVYVYNRREYNKQCLIGFVCVLHRNNCFKKNNPFKPGSNKTVTLHDAMLYGRERYHFGSLDLYKRNRKLCIDRALDRIPGLKLLDDNNYQKKQQLKKSTHF